MIEVMVCVEVDDWLALLLGEVAGVAGPVRVGVAPAAGMASGVDDCASARCSTWIDDDSRTDPSMRSAVARSPEVMVAGLSTDAGATVVVLLERRLRPTPVTTIAMTTIARSRRRTIEPRLRVADGAECCEVDMVVGVSSIAELRWGRGGLRVMLGTTRRRRR
ncbi:unannotated protein [freshwater metagenome]|uniref:Unannotated protein n=1 Tax=freshwater metagenome TaxID=449393 RepID=A0A6J6NJZ2_9ZZZZ